MRRATTTILAVLALMAGASWWCGCATPEMSCSPTACCCEATPASAWPLAPVPPAPDTAWLPGSFTIELPRPAAAPVVAQAVLGFAVTETALSPQARLRAPPVQV